MCICACGHTWAYVLTGFEEAQTAFKLCRPRMVLSFCSSFYSLPKCWGYRYVAAVTSTLRSLLMWIFAVLSMLLCGKQSLNPFCMPPSTLECKDVLSLFLLPGFICCHLAPRPAHPLSSALGLQVHISMPALLKCNSGDQTWAMQKHLPAVTFPVQTLKIPDPNVQY